MKKHIAGYSFDNKKFNPFVIMIVLIIGIIIYLVNYQINLEFLDIIADYLTIRDVNIIHSNENIILIIIDLLFQYIVSLMDSFNIVINYFAYNKYNHSFFLLGIVIRILSFIYPITILGVIIWMYREYDSQKFKKKFIIIALILIDIYVLFFSLSQTLLLRFGNN